ncbi:MAG: 2-C-methyl-D-erythritol 2,4-cyclodiphosphate synthase [Tissierellia bacterium]|nr:2-C-methyl-D-erythritol 2,4-cyclodiphosphate synthase [Tissierellia bacterium]
MRIGIGYDVHKFGDDRQLILGGINIPYERGLVGHSDADVLTHAIMDSILGALSLGDIGKLFPDTDAEYKDIDSTVLLSRVDEKMKSMEYEIGNIDTVLILQQPKVAPYIEEMRQKLSEVLNIEIDKISIKATTTEWLGFEGRGEGVSAQSVCILNKI